MAAAAVVATVVLLGSGIAYLISRAGDTPPARPAPPAVEEPTPDPEAEVITELEALLALKDQAFDTHDLELLEDVYVDKGPAARRAHDALQELVQQGVTDDSRFATKEMNVERLAREEAVVQRVNTAYPCFRSAEGRDITRATGVLEETVLYTLRLEAAKWQIFDVELVAERVVIKEQSSCARV